MIPALMTAAPAIPDFRVSSWELGRFPNVSNLLLSLTSCKKLFAPSRVELPVSTALPTAVCLVALYTYIHSFLYYYSISDMGMDGTQKNILSLLVRHLNRCTYTFSLLLSLVALFGASCEPCILFYPLHSLPGLEVPGVQSRTNTAQLRMSLF